MFPEDDDAPQQSLTRIATIIALKSGIETLSDGIGDGDTLCAVTTIDRNTLFGPVDDAPVLASLIVDFQCLESHMAAAGITFEVDRGDPREVSSLGQASRSAKRAAPKLAEQEVEQPGE